jgi:hypothetical protein
VLTKKDIDRLAKITRELESGNHRLRYRAWRDVLHLYEDVVTRARGDSLGLGSREFAGLRQKARQAFTVLGGMAEPVLVSLRHYDHTRYGSYLGVSDEGHMVERIRDAFLKSPKALVHGKLEPLVVGCAVDAERLGGAGEVPVGPDEYRDIQLACVGRVLTTTNVGTRVNVRYYNDPPAFTISRPEKAAAMKFAVAKAKTMLSAYLHTPDGNPVPVTLYVSFGHQVDKATQLAVLQQLMKEMQIGTISDPSVHHLGLLVRAPQGEPGREAVRHGVALAAKAGLEKVAVNGVLRREAQERISMPDLLNFFDKDTANKLWTEAEAKRIDLRAWKTVDVDSVARNTWTSLQAARNSGLYLGKYGMLPLTLSEADFVIGKIQSWFEDWSAAPAIYVDCPTVTPYRCYDEEAAEAVRAWLDAAHGHRVAVVLIDTADKSRGRKLLKDTPKDEVGILSEGEIRDLDAYARKLGIKALWAGGISAAQAYRFGKMGVFGIYTTTATARKAAVSGDYRHDPSMPNEKEPTYRGVCRVALLLQAGFVQGRLRFLGDSSAAAEVAQKAESLLALSRLQNLSEEEERDTQLGLAQSLQCAWRRLLKENQKSATGMRGVR